MKISNLFPNRAIKLFAWTHLIIFITSFCSCVDTSPDYSCTNFKNSITISGPSSASAGILTFTVIYDLCNDYSGGTLTFHSQIGFDGKKEHRTLSNLTGSEIFQREFSTAGKYVIWAEVEGNSKSRLSDEYPLVITGISTSKHFKVIQLQMKGYPLWPVETNEGYNGTSKRDIAFSEGNTIIDIQKDYRNIPNTPDISTMQKLIEWTVIQADGNINNSPTYDLDQNIAIVCSIINCPNYEGFNLTESDHGFNHQKYGGLPAMAYVLADRINNVYANSFDYARAMTGVGIHELGHARGIDGDDGTSTGLIPSCTVGASTCVMHSPYYVTWFTNPEFCANHKDFISNVNW